MEKLVYTDMNTKVLRQYNEETDEYIYTCVICVKSQLSKDLVDDTKDSDELRALQKDAISESFSNGREALTRSEHMLERLYRK